MYRVLETPSAFWLSLYLTMDFLLQLVADEHSD